MHMKVCMFKVLFQSKLHFINLDIVQNTFKHILPNRYLAWTQMMTTSPLTWQNSTILMHVKVKTLDDHELITPMLLQTTISLVQHQCSQSNSKSLEQIEKHFPTSKVMDALDIVYLMSYSHIAWSFLKHSIGPPIILTKNQEFGCIYFVETIGNLIGTWWLCLTMPLLHRNT